MTSLVSGVLSAKAEYDRQIAEGDNYTDWMSVLFVGGANAGLSFATFGIGSGAVKGAGVGTKLLIKHLGKAVVRDAAIGALTDAGIETARQLVTGTKITNLEYDRINEAGVMGGIIGGGSTLAGAALEGLAKTRVVKSAVEKISQTASKGTNAIKSGFAKIASKNGKNAAETVEGLAQSSSASIDSRAISNSVFNNGERIATTKQIRNYKKEMNGKGIFVVVDKKGKVLSEFRPAGFDYSKGTVYIKKKPGIIDLYHEGYHAEQYLLIGQEKYVELGTLAREEYVYSRIMQNSSIFNDAELQGATRYIERLRGGK